MTDFEVTASIADHDRAVLTKGLDAHTALIGAPPNTVKPLAVLKRGDGGSVVAGLTGETLWDWLYVHMLWVHTDCRKQGLASKLMSTAEAEALRRGCHSAWLWTEEYEGLNFYPKLGYKQFARMPDFPTGYQRFGFMKRLKA